MVAIRHDGRKVYTNSEYDVSELDLKRCKVCDGRIERAYFYERVLDRYGALVPAAVVFDESKMRIKDSGLRVKLKSMTSGAFLNIKGLECINGFLSELGVDASQLDFLKDRKVKGYYQGHFVLGISLVNKNQ